HDLMRPDPVRTLAKAGITAQLLRQASQGSILQIGQQTAPDARALRRLLRDQAEASNQRRSQGRRWGSMGLMALVSGGMMWEQHTDPWIAGFLVAAGCLALLFFHSGKCGLCHVSLYTSDCAEEGQIPTLNRMACCPHCGAEFQDQTLSEMLDA